MFLWRNHCCAWRKRQIDGDGCVQKYVKLFYDMCVGGDGLPRLVIAQLVVAEDCRIVYSVFVNLLKSLVRIRFARLVDCFLVGS